MTQSKPVSELVGEAFREWNEHPILFSSDPEMAFKSGAKAATDLVFDRCVEFLKNNDDLEIGPYRIRLYEFLIENKQKILGEK